MLHAGAPHGPTFRRETPLRSNARYAPMMYSTFDPRGIPKGIPSPPNPEPIICEVHCSALLFTLESTAGDISGCCNADGLLSETCSSKSPIRCLIIKNKSLDDRIESTLGHAARTAEADLTESPSQPASHMSTTLYMV